MANQYVTKEDLNYAAQKQKAKFQAKESGKSLVSDTEIEKLAGVAAGAQVNVLETVKVNGQAVSATDKAVDITVPTNEEIEGKISTAITEANVDGKISAAFEEADIDGKISTAIANANVDGKISTAIEAANIDGKIKAAVTGVYKVKGSVTLSNLPTDGVEEGHVYNITEDFTTTTAFVEGSGVEYPAGTNVVYTAEGKWDCMAGTYDFSDFVKSSDILEITEAEIDAMYAE